MSKGQSDGMALFLAALDEHHAAANEKREPHMITCTPEEANNPRWIWPKAPDPPLKHGDHFVIYSVPVQVYSPEEVTPDER